MTLQEIRKKADEAEAIVSMVKDALVTLLTDQMRSIEKSGRKLDLIDMNDVESITGVDFREIGEGMSFGPDAAAGEEQLFVGIFWDEESGAPMFFKEGDDEDVVSILDPRITMNDLLQAATLIEDWLKEKA